MLGDNWDFAIQALRVLLNAWEAEGSKTSVIFDFASQTSLQTTFNIINSVFHFDWICLLYVPMITIYVLVLGHTS